ncbi:MAG TPA: cytochrome c oxidase subunit II [Xanthobacteraceae bacterium]|jgi:cytochrome c oxidase subunit 2
MRRIDKVVIPALVIAIACGGVAFALFSFYDPIQAAFFAQAAKIVGGPVEWQFNFQHPFSEIEHDLYRFHSFLLGLNIAVCGLVAVLVVVAVWLFRGSRHPVPSRTAHNTPLEVTWTIIPVVILTGIATWSFVLLRKADIPPPAELTLKVTGNQWYWSYAYPDNGGIEFSSTIVPDDKLTPEQRPLRLLAVDRYVVLPVDAVIRIQITASDVVHSWGVQSLGVKKDAVPGRLNETWTRIEREGVYYGDCYELCGRNHAFMPIGIEAVSRERFKAWVEDARRRMAQGRPPAARAPVEVAVAAGRGDRSPRMRGQ